MTLSGPVPAEEMGAEDRWALAAAEMHLSRGDRESAVDAFFALRPRLGLPAAWGLARAWEAVGRLEDAAALFAGVAVEAGARGDWQLQVRALISGSRCRAEIGEDVAALDDALAARDVAVERGLSGTDEHAQALSALVGRFYTVGDLVQADRTARELLAMVDAGATWKARGSAYWNAAGVAEASGDIDTAVRYAERALALLGEGDDDRAWARCAVACAWFWMRHDAVADHLDQIERLLSDARSKLETCGTEVDLAYTETELARATLLAGRPDQAVAWAESALRRIGAEPRPETGTALLVLGEAHLARADSVSVMDAAGRLEMTLLALPPSRRAALAWRGLAALWRGVNDQDAAYRALEQALNAQAVPPSPGGKAVQRSHFDDQQPIQ